MDPELRFVCITMDSRNSNLIKGFNEYWLALIKYTKYDNNSTTIIALENTLGGDFPNAYLQSRIILLWDKIVKSKRHVGFVSLLNSILPVNYWDMIKPNNIIV